MFNLILNLGDFTLLILKSWNNVLLIPKGNSSILDQFFTLVNTILIMLIILKARSDILLILNLFNFILLNLKPCNNSLLILNTKSSILYQFFY